MRDVQHAAAALLDGGWTWLDIEELQETYGLSDEEADWYTMEEV